MNYLLMVLLAISLITATVILVVFVVVLGLWMRGTGFVAFPGLGLLVAAPVVLLTLFVAEGFNVFVAAYLVSRTGRDRVASVRSDERDIFRGCGNGVLHIAITHDPETLAKVSRTPGTSLRATGIWTFA